MTTTLPAGWKPRLSCPFCGSNFLFTEPDEVGSGGQWVSPIHVGCNDCKAEQVGDTEDEAVSRWNARSTPPASAQDERDWELDCDHCNGSGHVFVKHQVAERTTDVQEFKEECECCEGRGFVFAFQDIPGIAEYVKSCRSGTQDAPITVSLDPDPRGVSVGVWQGSRCIYNGAHAVPVAPGDAQDERSPTHGMTLGERIAHVGGHTNAQGYVEFGSPMAVNALIQHVLRDIDWTRQDDDGAYQARYRLPGGQWSSWGHVVCGVKGHEQELRYLPSERRPAPAAGDAQDDQTRWTLRWIMRQADAAKETCGTDPESPAAIRNAKLAAIATAAAQALGLVRGPSYADSAGGDALDAARWRWVLSHAENIGFDYRSGRFTTLTVAGRQGDSLVAFVDAALAAQVPHKGDAA